MLTNNHTKSHKRWLYLSVLPLIAILLLAFQTSDLEQLAESPVKVLEVIPGVSEVTIAVGIPSLFPLPEKYRDKVTWGFDVKAINPITKKEMTHRGVDISAPTGTSVFAASGGIVKTAELLEGWGNLIVIEHSDGFTTHYAHLEGFRVEAGDKVSKGETVATVGNTGRSTGPHLHFEVRKEGASLNPEDYY